MRTALLELSIFLTVYCRPAVPTADGSVMVKELAAAFVRTKLSEAVSV